MANLSKINYKGVTYDIYDSTALHSGDAYVLPTAKHNVLGGVKPLYANTNAVTGVTAASGAKTVAVNALTTTTGKYYAVEVDTDGRLYVNVPWTDTDKNTTYSLSGASQTGGYVVTLTAGGSGSGTAGTATVPVMAGATGSAAGSFGLVPTPTAGAQTKFLRGDGSWVAITDTNTTYTLSGASQTAGGYKVTLTAGGSGSGEAGTATIPRYVATYDGLVPVATTAQATENTNPYFLSASGSWRQVQVFDHTKVGLVPLPTAGAVSAGNYFLNADATWKEAATAQLWYCDDLTRLTTTFPAENILVSASYASSITGYSGTPKVGDMFITKAGYVGFWTAIGSSAQSQKATVIGKLDFMAYSDNNGVNGTMYDATTQTLTLGAY